MFPMLILLTLIEVDRAETQLGFSSYTDGPSSDLGIGQASEASIDVSSSSISELATLQTASSQMQEILDGQPDTQTQGILPSPLPLPQQLPPLGTSEW